MVDKNNLIFRLYLYYSLYIMNIKQNTNNDNDYNNDDYNNGDYMDDLNYAIHQSLKHFVNIKDDITKDNDTKDNDNDSETLKTNAESITDIINRQNMEYKECLENDIKYNNNNNKIDELSPNSLRNIRIKRFSNK